MADISIAELPTNANCSIRARQYDVMIAAVGRLDAAQRESQRRPKNGAGIRLGMFYWCSRWSSYALHCGGAVVYFASAYIENDYLKRR